MTTMQRGLNAHAEPFVPERSYFNRPQQEDDAIFSQFPLLGEDIVIHILSFVAEAPLENTPTNISVSSLTHSLPLVSKQFHRLVQSDCFWKDSLMRQVMKEPSLWKKGLEELQPNAPAASAEGEEDNSNIVVKPEQANEIVENLQNKGNRSCLDLYRQVLNTKIRFTLPIFYMGHDISLGQPYGLHLFEPRYRLLLREIMAPFPDSAKQGGPIYSAGPGQNPPLFIHAHIHPLSPSTPACLVQVVRCRIHPHDGRADVFLLPIAYVRMERIWERPNTGRLYHGQCLRVGQRVTEELERHGGGMLSPDW